MTKRLVIFTYGGGRTCNQMLNCAHLLAVSLELSDEVEFCNLPALEFESLYPQLVAQVSSQRTIALRLIVKSLLLLTASSNRLRRRTLERILPAALHVVMPYFGVQWIGVVNEQSKCIRGERVSETNLLRLLSDSAVSRFGIIGVGGWGLRDWSLAMKYRAEIAKLITAENPHYTGAATYLGSLHKPKKRLIGVLIRQTDYKQWSGGRYFFETTDYIRMMQLVSSEVETQFLVASDVSQDRELFSNLDVIFASGKEIGRAHYMESFFELALCSAILSPPSSFALMAAYVGGGVLIKMTANKQLGGELRAENLSVDGCWNDPDFSQVS